MKTIITLATAALLAASAANAAGLRHFLISQWYEAGSQMCKYDNGTVLNVGINICPLSI